jgi:long-subunit fatty acid transport protein
VKTLLPAILLISLGSAVAAQDLGAFYEATAGNFFGIGARQMSMGGAGIASSWDGAALYYNPAALARIHRIEFQLGITHQKFSNETTQPGNRYNGFTSTKNTASADITKTRLGTLNLTIPAPTYRGSLVIAFGVNRINSFDRVDQFNVIDDSLGYLIEDYGNTSENGGIYAYSAGAAMDISPKISLGAAVHIYSGSKNYLYDYYFRDQALGEAVDSTADIKEDYIGISLKGGILVRPNADLNIGLTMETPLDYQVEYTYLSTFDQFYVEYDLSRPFIFGAGAAYRFSTFTVTADVEYADWSQMTYNDNSAMETYNEILTLLYRDVLNLRVGAEYQIPSAGLALRAGYFSEPLPYQEDYIESDRKGYSFGFGWLMDKVLMFEAAYVYGSFGRYFTAPNAEYISNPAAATATAEDEYSRLYVTMSYRY